MDPQSHNAGGPANTPPFGDDLTAVQTAADHQIPEQTSPSHGAAFGGTTQGATTGGGTATGRQGGQAQSEGGQMGQVAGQAQQKVNQGIQQAADRLDQAARQVDRLANERLGGSGAQARAGQMAHSLADSMESVAGYLRSSDTDTLRRDLERQVRERPLQTLLIAVATGWVTGKILR